jgi:hypothetical protein
MRMSTDPQIRAALHKQKLKHLHARPDTLIVDELGLVHADVIVDVAVINGYLHGFEIKSAADTLSRLPRQIKLYEECLEKLTIVCDKKHSRRVTQLAPSWCGIMEVSRGARGGISFSTLRPPKLNPHVRPERLAHLLWRPEVVELLRKLDVSPKVLRQPRKQLYDCLAEHFTTSEITAFIRQSMAARQVWRRLPKHA